MRRSHVLLPLVLAALATLTTSWLIALTANPSRHTDATVDDLRGEPSYDPVQPRTGAVNLTAHVSPGMACYITRFETRHTRSEPPPPSARARTAPDIIAPWALPLAAPWRADKPWPYGPHHNLQALVPTGWPRPAFYAVYTSHRAPGTLSPFRGGIELPGRAFTTTPDLTRSLPYLPIWRGLLVNTLLNAFLVTTLIAVFHFLRRRGRYQRGACATCGYSLRGLPVAVACPECGHPRCIPSAAR